MTLNEANAYAKKMNRVKGTSASVARILPVNVDPIREGDNGWDVEVTQVPV